MIVPEFLVITCSNLRNKRSNRLYNLYDSISSTSLTEHKSQGYNKHEEFTGINVTEWAINFSCNDSMIYKDLKFLQDQNIIVNDGVYSMGFKSYYYKPSTKILNSKCIEVDIKPVDNIQNMNSPVCKEIVKNVKITKIDTDKSVKYLSQKLEVFRTEKKASAIIRPIKRLFKVERSKIIRDNKNIKAICCNLLSLPCLNNYNFSRLNFYTKNFGSTKTEKNPNNPTVSDFTIDAKSWLEPRISKFAFDLREGNLTDDNKVLYHEYAKLLYSVKANYNLHYGIYSMSKSVTNKRVRHNIVECPRELRQFIYHPKHKILNVDMANSQPVIEVATMLNEGVPVEQSLIDAVRGGNFYNTIKEAAHLTMGYNDLKSNCLRFLYSQAVTNRKEAKQVGTVSNAYKRLWPISFEWIVNRKDELNKPRLKNRKAKRGSQLFAIEMQRLESKWMIDKVLKRLFKNNKNVWAVSMHDGCLISEPHAKRLQTIMIEEFNKLFGFKPLVRIESV